MIKWRDAMAVGHADIDADHKHLIDLINLFETGRDDNVEATLFELVRYTAYHFQREEKLQMTLGFPLAAPHKQSHEHLLAEANALLRRWESSPGEQHRALMGEIAPFLRGWLIDHIINEDLLMKPFIRH